MTHHPDKVLARFHRALVRELQANNPDALTSPFSVAEIYQNLVPYRTHRDEIGVEMNGDYEHALLRLLAGEGDFLTIESRTARQEIREELESPNPNTALYRDFAAADVLLNPDKIDEALMGEESEAEAEEEGSGEEAPTAFVEEPEEGPAAGGEDTGGDIPVAEAATAGEEEGSEEEVLEEEVLEEKVLEEKVLEEEVLEGEEEEAVAAGESGGDVADGDEGEVEGEEGAGGGEETASGETPEEWRDPSSWLEPSIETLREEYERNRDANLLESGDVMQADEELASGSLPFEVSVQKGTGKGMEETPKEEEVRVESTAGGQEAFEVPENCAWCREKLPDRPGVNFCPFCGMSVKLVPCSECGEELELNWRFCIACGTEVSS